MLTKFINNEWEKIPLVQAYRNIQHNTEDHTKKNRTPQEALQRIFQSKQHIYDFLNLLRDNLTLFDSSSKQYAYKIEKLATLFNNEGNESLKTKIYDIIPEIFDDYGDPINPNKYGKKRMDVILLESDKRVQEILNGI